MSKHLSSNQIEAAAQQHELDPKLLRALIQVESGGSGFLPDGRCKILFERHVFYRRLLQREIDADSVNKNLPLLCGTAWAPRIYPYGSQTHQYEKLAEIQRWAEKWRPQQVESFVKASLESCSWGLFQLMGYHYETLTLSNVYEFRKLHEESEAQQLELALQWMAGNGLLAKLRKRQLLQFVAGYNGIGQVPKYLGKFQAALKELA